MLPMGDIYLLDCSQENYIKASKWKTSFSSCLFGIRHVLEACINSMVTIKKLCWIDKNDYKKIWSSLYEKMNISTRTKRIIKKKTKRIT